MYLYFILILNKTKSRFENKLRELFKITNYIFNLLCMFIQLIKIYITQKFCIVI
jgi:hypothetical protein